jgi:hypothetical protein
VSAARAVRTDHALAHRPVVRVVRNGLACGLPSAALRCNSPDVRKLLFAALATALATGTASAAPERDALIRPGVGIGKVRLGMTLAQVRAALGPHTLVNKRQRLGFGQQYLELDWDYGQWLVGLIGRPNRMRVVRIGTLKRTERTARGVGIGTRIQQVRRVFPNARCLTYSRSRMEIRHRNGSRTRFFIETDPARYLSAPFVVYDIWIDTPNAPRLEAEARSVPCPAEWFMRGG